MDEKAAGKLAGLSGVEPTRKEDIVENLDREFLPVNHPKYQGLAEQQGYSQDYGRIKRVHYTHDAMIDMILAEPMISQDRLAVNFGYSVPWISRIMGSDAFQAKLTQRREELSDPFLVATIEDRLRGLADRSLDILADKLEATKSADLALKVADLSLKAQGFGARDRTQVMTQNNYVVQLPSKAASAEDWAQAYGGGMGTVKMVETMSPSTTITRDPTVQPKKMGVVEGEIL